MKIGVIVRLDKNLKETFKELTEMGIYTCQLNCWVPERFTDEMAEFVKETCAEYGVEVTALWCGWSGPSVWNFYDGPATLGLVPCEYRHQRLNDLMAGSAFAEKIGVSHMVTHVGFLPEDPNTKEYNTLIPLLRYLAECMKEKGQTFLFETGQETPVTLRRVIEDIGTGNLGINLDPANLILYGKANPVDALDVFGEFVMNIHGKDGNYPKDGKNLGEETRMGDGKVNYPLFIKKLKEIGYDGPITIEREISGEEQKKDILYAKNMIEELWNK